MSREIRFRVWLKYNDVEQMMPHEWIMGTISQGDGYSLEDFSNLMQLTGLKDKNGREIYEGDIVQFPDKIARYGHVARDVVEYKDGGFWPFTDPYIPVAVEELEIIGNVYENPELISKP